MLDVVVFLVSLGVRVIRAMCRRRADLVLENVALRQQVTALKKERPRPPLEDTERAFWVALRGSWPVWASRLLIVHADTVARWHRDRFRRYWAKMSQRRHPGRPRIDAEIRRLVRTMAQDGWGAPRIHAELTKLGFIISEITVSRYLPRRPAEPDQLKRWMAFWCFRYQVLLRGCGKWFRCGRDRVARPSEQENLDPRPVASIYSSASLWVGSQPCGAKYPGFCADSKGV